MNIDPFIAAGGGSSTMVDPKANTTSIDQQQQVHPEIRKDDIVATALASEVSNESHPENLAPLATESSGPSSNSPSASGVVMANSSDSQKSLQMQQLTLYSSSEPSTSSLRVPIWCHPKATSTPKKFESTRVKKDLADCVNSELSARLPLQLGTSVNPLFKEGYTYTLHAPTSGLVRSGEDPLTYLNKDQFYTLTLEFNTSVTGCGGNGRQHRPAGPVSSMIMLQFRERKEPDEAMSYFEFWHSRQPSPHLRLIDVDHSESRGVIGQPNEIAHNAVVVSWIPSKSAVIMVAVRCLSTDFSSQKGIKGIPLHIQIDTYEGNRGSEVCDRGFCQIKTFCDKGAERKSREEEKRMSKHQECYGNSYNTFVHSRSTFQRAFDLVTEPVLYSPKTQVLAICSEPVMQRRRQPAILRSNSQVIINNRQKTKRPTRSESSKRLDGPREIPPPTNRTTGTKSDTSRVLVYVRQENEELYTPLHVVPPTVRGLTRAVSSMYKINNADIRFLFLQTNRGILVHMDDDLVRYYCNGCVFVMKILVTEETSNGGRAYYDAVLIDEMITSFVLPASSSNGIR